ncbi:hypothetical protein FA15DRAFT_663948 [Coprinopsis marcescibilis]|uniref:Uncharacterized protein n=1 Tax=Coprinopsis marcescibilis TaxID=230819 RepID=A0A5C3LCT0_COPMA|nr:hypothetical protein FA15DRAFT_663948 [Coprinopsis marcescibilis]
MSLDQNLFTLIFTQNKEFSNVVDLVDPSGNVYYHKRKVPGSEYKIEVYDPLSQALLITASAPTPSSKSKMLELHNPTILVELKSTGTLTFKWSFKWEEHEFEWKREQCFLVRKPDPPVLVAVTKEQTGRLKSPQVQILDYNINRFDIDDRKGLEIVMLTVLMTFHDANANESPSVPSLLGATRAASPVVLTVDAEEAPPPPPPKPDPKSGMDRIAEIQAEHGEYNEVVIGDEGAVLDYAEYCNNLLNDDAMLFISVKSSSPQDVPKVLQVVEETKRIRYKAGLDEDGLHQYVLYDLEKKKGPRRIDLNDDAQRKAKYAPPDSLVVHLSKIEMPELKPKTLPSMSDKGRKMEEKEKKAPAVIPPAPSSRPVSPPVEMSRPSSSSGNQDAKAAKPPKLKKPKLVKPPRGSETAKPQTVPLQPPSTYASHSPHTSSPASYTAPTPSYPMPTTGLFNSAPPSPNASTHRPSKSHGGGSGYETPGLSLYSSFAPYMAAPKQPQQHPPHYPSRSTSHPMPYSSHPPPPPSVPARPPPQMGGPPSTLGMAASVAQNAMSGLFDKLNQHRK